MKFDILEIQNQIETKRLILGKKLENFLLNKLKKIRGFFINSLNKKSFAIFGCFLILSFGVFCQSIFNISANSALILENAKNAKNFDFESFLAIIPIFLSKIFNINSIFTSFLFNDLLGILSLYFCYQILKNSNQLKNIAILNLIILSFALAFFCPPLTLAYNQVISNFNYLLFLMAPLISYQINGELKAKKIHQILIAIISSLICLIDINFIVFIGFFYIKNLFKNDKKLFFLEISLILLFLSLFFHLNLIKFSQAFSFNFNSLQTLFKLDLFPILLLFYLTSFLKNKLLNKLFFTAFAVFFSIILKNEINIFDREIFYCTSLLSLTILAYLILKNNKINFKKDLIFILLIFLIPQFDRANIFDIFLELPLLWWIFVLIFNKKWQKKLGKNKNIKTNFLEKIFLINNKNSIILFILSSFISIYLVIFQIKLTKLLWPVFAIIFALFVNFAQRIHEEILLKKYFSRLFLASILLIFSYYDSLYYKAFFNKDSNLISQNYINEEIAKNIKTYNKNNQSILIIANSKKFGYPAIKYLEIDSKNILRNYKEFKQEINQNKNHLIFIENDVKKCQIGFLENYFLNEDLKKEFLKKYNFVNRIIEIEENERKVRFFEEKQEIFNEKTIKFIKNDIDIYVKK